MLYVSCSENELFQFDLFFFWCALNCLVASIVAIRTTTQSSRRPLFVGGIRSGHTWKGVVWLRHRGAGYGVRLEPPPPLQSYLRVPLLEILFRTYCFVRLKWISLQSLTDDWKLFLRHILLFHVFVSLFSVFNHEPLSFQSESWTSENSWAFSIIATTIVQFASIYALHGVLNFFHTGQSTHPSGVGKQYHSSCGRMLAYIVDEWSYLL